MEGFTAREWQAQEESRWMEETQLKSFCSRLEALRGLVEALANKELLNCARSKGRMRADGSKGWREWASGLVSAAARRPLSVQPGTLEDIKAYSQSMRAQGCDPNFVVFNGLGTPGGTEQLLDFPLEDGVPILRLGRALFGADFSAVTWLRAVEFHDLPTAWQFAVGQVVG